MKKGNVFRELDQETTITKIKDSNQEADHKGMRNEDLILRVSIIFSIIGVLLIVLSNRIGRLFIHNSNTMYLFNRIISWILILFLIFFIYCMLAYYKKKIRMLKSDIVNNNFKLSLADKEIELIKELFDSLIDDKLLLQKENEIYRNRIEDLEELHNVILDTSREVIWDDRNGDLHFSDRWYEITGYTKKEYIKTEQWEKFLHPMDLDHVVLQMQDIEKNGVQFFQFESRIKVQNGQYRWFHTRGKSFKNANGQICRRIGVCTDVTELKGWEGNPI